MLFIVMKASAYVFGTDNHYVTNSSYDFKSYNPGYPYDYYNFSPKIFTDLEVATRDLQNDRKFLRSDSKFDRKFTTHGSSNKWLPN